MSKKSQIPLKPPAKQKAGNATDTSSLKYWILVGVVILFFAVIRFRLFDMPLERDEGEYAYAGQLILQGIPPYQLAYNMKLPGAYVAYAVIMAIFGQSPAGIHAGLLIVNAASVILIFLLARRMWGRVAGLAAGASYALLSTSEGVLGFAAHATHFVVLAALGGIVLLLQALDSGKMLLYWLSGLLFGLAFVFKQPGIFFVFFGAFLLIIQSRPARDRRGLVNRLAIYGIGVATPFLLTCMILFLAGVLGKMLFWTFSYASQYASVESFRRGWQNLVFSAPSVLEPCLLIWIIAGTGLAALAWDSRVWRTSPFLLGILSFSSAAVFPGLYFREHYFVVLLPAASLLAGVAVSSATNELSRHFPSHKAVWAVPSVVLLAAMVVSVSAQRDILFQLNPVAVCRRVYQKNPFLEAQVIAAHLRAETAPGATIAVMGSEPEIFFYAERHSATGYIYMYPLMERQKYALDMQKEMAQEIEDNRPEYIVIVNVDTSWLPKSDSNPFLFEWFRTYIADHYEIIGIADEVAPETLYLWGGTAKTYRVQSDASVQVMKRRDT